MAVHRFLVSAVLLFGCLNTPAASTAVTTYTAITDRSSRPKPRAPALGGAGSIVTDPTFGSRILRVTDANSQANAPATSFHTPVLSWVNNWNADGTLFWVFGKNGTIPYRFDPATMKATRIPNPADPSGGLLLKLTGAFSFTRPNILYGTVGLTIVEYDFNTNSTKTVFDTTKAVPGVGQYVHQPSVSADDSKLCVAFGGQQGAFPYVAVLDRASGVYHVLNTSTSKIDGKKANITLGFGLYSAFLDRTGRYVTLLTGGGVATAVWDVANGSVYKIVIHGDGASAAGFASLVNMSGFNSPSFSDPVEWSERSLSQANINNSSYLVDPYSLPTPHQSIYDGRISWANAQSGGMVPLAGSVNRDSRSTLPWRAWDDEIFAVATDGSGKVWRFAHHRSVWDTSSYWDEARGSVSQDGRFYLFNSNWDRLLGNDPATGKPRQDVFIVELSGRDTSAPTVAITSPAPGQTLSGSVAVQASASDPAGIAGVQFKIDGANLGAEVATAPYTVTWNCGSIAPGSHTLSAVARDTVGNLATSAGVAVTVADTTAPTVAISSPANGTSVSGVVNITASASDPAGIAGVQFYVNGVAQGAEDTVAPYSVAWNTAGLAVRTSRTLTAVARDTAGNKTTSAPVSVTIADTTPPKVSIASPAAGATVAGAVAVSATATDNVGVARVQFLLNGAPLGGPVATAPYVVSWNTTTVANGSYNLVAQASDAAGNSASSATVTVQVSNVTPVPAPPACTLSSPANGATSVATNAGLGWSAAANAASYDVYLGATAPPPLVGNTTATSYAPGTLAAGQTYYWYVVSKNSAGSTASATWSFTTAASSGGGGGGSTLSYTSPYCGPSGGSTSWACGAWPTTNAPALGPAGSTVADPDTGNRVLRVTQDGSFPESAGTAYKAFDGGWRQAWNANDTRFLVLPWTTGNVSSVAYWVGFNASSMSLTGAKGSVPNNISDFQWDQSDPDSIVGIVNGVAKSYNVVTSAYTTIFDPSTTSWGGTPWLSSWGGPSVCISEGMQDSGYRLVCYNKQTRKSQAINLHTQTINGQHFNVSLNGSQVTLPGGVGVHTITLAPDGRWLAIDTHGNTACSIGGLSNYASTALFLDLQNSVGYEWEAACGLTHWAYGYNSVMMQSASPKWTPTGANGPCNSDSRGIGHRNTDSSIDSSYYNTQPCTIFNPATWNISVHLSWTNNAGDANVNKYPVLMVTTNEGVSNMFLWQDIAAVETSAPAYQAKTWRFAQHWNDQYSQQCGFLMYSSPAISRSGRFALFPSDWRGQTGSSGVCTNGKRTDLFLFELR